MNIQASRLFPYPVISYMNDDYKKTEFKVEIVAQKSKKFLVLDMDVKLSNKELEELYNKDKLSIICHIECSKSKYRNILNLDLNQSNHFEIPSIELNGKIEILPLIVAKEKIVNYNSKDFNDDYGFTNFNISRGSILGIDECISINFEKDIYDMSKVSSVFSIVKNSNKIETRMIVDMADQKIRIKLPEEEYKTYNEFSKSSTCNPILNSIIFIPALVYIFENLKREAETKEETYSSYRWFKVLSKKLNEHNVDIMNTQLNGKESIELAQIIMENPISQSFYNIKDSIA